MSVELNAHEARVLGVLIEKSMTTPEQYPLSLNAATNGSNQKSNRDPQVDFSEAEVTVAMTGLQFKHLIGGVVPAGSRVEKFRHNAKEILGIDDQELAVVAELLLRGPQTAGELRTRAKRMRDIPNLEDLDRVVRSLQDKGYLRPAPPAPGSRAGRFTQTLCAARHVDGEADATQAAAATLSGSSATHSAALPQTAEGPSPTPLGERFTALEAEVHALKCQLRALAEALGETLPEGEPAPRRLGE